MKNILIIACACTLLGACKDDDDETPIPAAEEYKGFLYTTNNATTGNGVIALGRKGDGTLQELPGSPYITGSAGDAADGDFDTQNAARIFGDFLLTVNAGNNPANGTVSVFRINRTSGALQQVDQNPSTTAMDNIDSRGIRPSSIAVRESGATVWVLVSNQHSNPHYEMTPAMAVGTVASSPMRNLAVFTLNKSTGVLSYMSIGATYMDGSNGGPTNVEFSNGGNKVAVSTWGVAHIMTPDADLSLQKPGRLYIYDFSSTGTLTQTGMYEETGVSGNIGFSWSANDQYIYLSNFNLHSTKEMNSVTVHDAATGTKIQNFGSADRNDEACWTWVSRDRTKLYVVSFAQNVVNVFDIGSDYKLSQSLSPNFFTRRGNPPMGDSKDMYQTTDGYLYVAGAYQTHTVAGFRIGSGGALAEVAGSPYAIPSSAGKTKDQHAYLGLTGFDR